MIRRAQSAAWLAACLCGLGAAPSRAYQDHYIDGGNLAPDIYTGDSATADTSGLARSLQVDAVASSLSSNDGGAATSSVESGIVVRSQWETAGYGAWSLDGAARTGASGQIQSSGGQGAVLTLRERGMPFDGSWQADSGAGDINSPDIGLARLQPRFYLPTAPMQGLSTEWRGPSDLQLVAGAGTPGVFDGIIVPDFRVLHGSMATAGAQWSPAAHWTVGGQFIDASGVDPFAGDVPFAPGSGLQLSSHTGLAIAAWRDHDESLQLNLIDGAAGGAGNSLGAWLDGTMTEGRITHAAGLFRLDPNLTWGDQLISNDLQGGYYRFGYQSRSLVADIGIDQAMSVSGRGNDTTFLTADMRRQLSRDWGAGGLANLSHAGGASSWSVQGYVDHIGGWGTTRVQGSYATSPNASDAAAAIDESWLVPSGLRLSTSAGIDRARSSEPFGPITDSTLLSLSANGGGQVTARLGVEGNVRWATAVQGRAAPGVYANVAVSWQLSPSWTVLATYYDSRVSAWTPLSVTSPLTPPLATPLPSMQDRGMFLTLRYQRAAGLHFAPLGGAPGAGAGALGGVVYLDANDNGRPDAGEAGAANVTVVLDGRFSVQTDASGRFEFPVVAAGHHVLTVISDNLPLPWVLANDGRTAVEVSNRERTEIPIGAHRIR